MSFFVGDVVRLSEHGKRTFKDSQHNPHNLTGVIESVKSRVGWPFWVVWDKGPANIYKQQHLEMAKMIEYEDKWHLNDGSPIPDDADKLMKDGSVVAYRLVKKPVVKEFVRYALASNNSYVTSPLKLSDRGYKLIFVEVDGELKEVKVEKL